MTVRVARRGRLIVAGVVAALIAVYAVAHLIGRSADPMLSREVASGVSPTPTTGGDATDAGPAAANGADANGADTNGADPDGAIADVADTDTVNRAAALPQPVVGPGLPPIPMTGTGPYGSLRTTGADYVALTFDDGPDPRWTPRVLELLRDYQVRATFCVVGELVVEFPELVQEIVSEGHTLCNHTWNHDMGLGRRSRAEIRADLLRTHEAIQAAVPGARVSYYRQPGGAWTQRVIDVAEEMGMSSLHWQVDPQDWLPRRSARAISSDVTAGAGPGAIVLLHDGGGERSATVQALETILADLTGRYLLEALPPGVDPPRRHGIELPLKPGQI